MPLQLPILTERLVVRRLQPGDLQRFSAYRADPLLARYQGWSPMTRDEARAFIATMQTQPLLEPDQWVQLAIADAAGDDLLGDIGLCLHANGHAEIGFTLRRQAQGQGFAVEALRGLSARLLQLPAVARIVGLTDARNAASIRVLQRLGMTLVASVEATFKHEACVELRFELGRSVVPCSDAGDWDGT